MRHINLKSCSLKESPSGEKFQVVVGRHENHGAAKNHTIAIVEIGVGGSSDAHFHKEREESYYVISGNGLAKIGEHQKNIQAGDLVCANPLDLHQFFNTGLEPLRYMVITAPSWIPEDSWS